MACEREKINSFNVTGSVKAGILLGKGNFNSLILPKFARSIVKRKKNQYFMHFSLQLFQCQTLPA